MTPLPAMPIGDPVDATVAAPGGLAVATTGRAFLIPDDHPVTQVKVYASARCHVAFGNDASPPSAPADWKDEPGVLGRAIQQTATEEVYTRARLRGAALPYVWVAAATGTVDVDISYF